MCFHMARQCHMKLCKVLRNQFALLNKQAVRSFRTFKKALLSNTGMLAYQ